MPPQLMAWTADGGVPLFIRKRPEDSNIPFALMGTINGLNIFANANNASLISTATKNGNKIIWKAYYGSILLIYLTSKLHSSEAQVDHLLDNVFNTMVMVVGMDALKVISNVERLKRELKVCFNVIDHFLYQNELEHFTMGDLVAAADRIICKDNALFQNYLDTFTVCGESAFGCLLMKGKLLVATKKWAALPPPEISLLQIFINSSPKAMAREMYIYLPDSCPNMCNRLVTFQLTQDVELCVLWGNSTNLSQIEEEVFKSWKGAYDALKLTASVSPRNLPSTIIIDPNILGLLLINRNKNQCLYSLRPIEERSDKKESQLSYKECHHILRDTYEVVEENYMEPNSIYPRIPLKEVSVKAKKKVTSTFHKPIEAYFQSDNHTCYYISDGVYQFFVLFTSIIPKFAMKKVCETTLKSLTTYKHCPF